MTRVGRLCVALCVCAGQGAASLAHERAYAEAEAAWSGRLDALMQEKEALTMRTSQEKAFLTQLLKEVEAKIAHSSSDAASPDTVLQLTAAMRAQQEASFAPPPSSGGFDLPKSSDDAYDISNLNQHLPASAQVDQEKPEGGWKMPSFGSGTRPSNSFGRP